MGVCSMFLVVDAMFYIVAAWCLMWTDTNNENIEIVR